MADETAQQWAALLQKHQDPYAAAEEFSDWMPPLGEYTCVIESVRTGAAKEGHAYWALKGKLLDGMDPVTGESLVDRTFDMGYFSTKVPGMLKTLASALNGGVSIGGDLVVADGVLQGSVGKFCRIEIVLSKNGVYTNCKVKEVIAPED